MGVLLLLAFYLCRAWIKLPKRESIEALYAVADGGLLLLIAMLAIATASTSTISAGDLNIILYATLGFAAIFNASGVWDRRGSSKYLRVAGNVVGIIIVLGTTYLLQVKDSVWPVAVGITLNLVFLLSDDAFPGTAPSP